MKEPSNKKKKSSQSSRNTKSETPTIYLFSEEIENGKLQGGFSQTRLNGQELLMEGDQVIQEIIYRELKLNLFKEEVLKKTMTISTQISIVFFGTQ